MKSNIHEFPGLVRLAHKYGVRHMYVARLHVSKEEILNKIESHMSPELAQRVKSEDI